MRYGSICSGIEGASVAWCALNWQPAWFSEVDPFCCELLRKRYSSVENLGDATAIQSAPAIDLLVGGTPCQSFSIQGLRRGMDDARGNLLAHFCRILGKVRPRWIVWENVPGVMSTNGGRDFGSLLGALDEFGYGWCYRVLDARYFGLAQRRKRVFVVGHFRDWRSAAAVLLEQRGTGEHCPAPEEISEEDPARLSLFAGDRTWGWTGDETPKFGYEITPTLRAYQGGEGVGVLRNGVMRRLTVKEWERLQGFPDGYTAIEFNGKPASDKQRTTALGNSFPVPVLRWIGERIAFVERVVRCRSHQ